MDDKLKVGAADRQRISIHQYYERRDWANRLGITQARLKAVVSKVGPMVEDVKKELIEQITNA